MRDACLRYSGGFDGIEHVSNWPFRVRVVAEPWGGGSSVVCKTETTLALDVVADGVPSCHVLSCTRAGENMADILVTGAQAISLEELLAEKEERLRIKSETAAALRALKRARGEHAPRRGRGGGGGDGGGRGRCGGNGRGKGRGKGRGNGGGNGRGLGRPMVERVLIAQPDSDGDDSASENQEEDDAFIDLQEADVKRRRMIARGDEQEKKKEGAAEQPESAESAPPRLGKGGYVFDHHNQNIGRIYMAPGFILRHRGHVHGTKPSTCVRWIQTLRVKDMTRLRVWIAAASNYETADLHLEDPQVALYPVFPPHLSVLGFTVVQDQNNIA